MLKKYKGTLWASSVLTVLPILAGVILWNQLPQQVATHWGIDGTADGFSSKGFAVLGLPLILLAFHWGCVFISSLDQRYKDQNAKLFSIVLWIIPVISLFINTLIYAAALGKSFNVLAAAICLMGALFIVIGNYMPKCKQNRTLGIKIKWTLENEENWNATHRMSGKLWVAGGLLFFATALLPAPAAAIVVTVLLIALVAVPVIYSYVYHKKHG